MKKTTILFSFLMLLALATFASVVAAAFPIATVNGGGKAVFVDSVTFPEVVGTTTAFSVSAKIYPDGSADGHFTCLIPGVFVINGSVENGEIIGDEIIVSGPALFVDKSFGNPPFIVDGTFSVKLKAGGPGVGGFVYADDVTVADTEVVTHGSIKIKIDE